jgi:hypothetical protein
VAHRNLNCAGVVVAGGIPGAVRPLSRTDAAVPSRPVSLVPVPLSRSREQSVSIGGCLKLSLGERTDLIASRRTATGRLASTLQLARTAPRELCVRSNAHSGVTRNFASAG